MSKNILSLHNISYSYHTIQGETKALKDISFDLQQGEFLAIVGPSGCGKTTLLSIIAGLLTPQSGTIVLPHNSKDMRSSIGYMLQRDHLFSWRTIYQNAILGLEIQNKLSDRTKAYVEHLLEEYELADFSDKYPDQLSGGMKQRVALIRTLALNPDILLLDEPFSALDYQTRLNVSDDICKRIRKAGKTVILITHDLSEAISLSDRILVLSKRPSTIKYELNIELDNEHRHPVRSRTIPEFGKYFNILWEELQNESDSIN
ncbi:MAG: ABC transporter ATP-binding protein [Lachnospiraceae bacterium]|nr:ABC transporter ATP-binding protein [Lachnospiraceae bacterium]